MKLHIPGLPHLPFGARASIEKAAAEHGLTVVPATESAVSRLWGEVKQAFPQVVADIEKGIADLAHSPLTGGDRAVQVAEDVLKTAPEVLKALPQLKDLLVHGVTEVFAVGVGSLEHDAAALLPQLLAKAA